MLTLLLLAAPARADVVAPADPFWQVRSQGRVAVDAGLVMGSPAAWQTGLTTGVGAGVSVGRRLLWGVRASWSTATESSLTWTVTRQDIRARAMAGIQQVVGRGAFGLRLDLGPTIVHEGRVRNQGMRAGLTGSDLETSTFATLPAAELEAVITVHVAGRWLLTVAGGPSLLRSDGAFHGGWIAQLGVGWQP